MAGSLGNEMMIYKGEEEQCYSHKKRECGMKKEHLVGKNINKLKKKKEKLEGDFRRGQYSGLIIRPGIGLYEAPV